MWFPGVWAVIRLALMLKGEPGCFSSPLLHSPPSFLLLFCNLLRPLQPAEELRLRALHLSIPEFGKIASIKQTAGFHKSLATILKSIFLLLLYPCLCCSFKQHKKGFFSLLMPIHNLLFFNGSEYICHLYALKRKEEQKEQREKLKSSVLSDHD